MIFKSSDLIKVLKGTIDIHAVLGLPIAPKDAASLVETLGYIEKDVLDTEAKLNPVPVTPENDRKVVRVDFRKPGTPAGGEPA